MSILYITEYANAINGIPVEPSLASQTVSFTGTPGTSAAFNPSTSYLNISADGIGSIAFGTAPTATTTSRRIVAGQNIVCAIQGNKAYKVSAITNT